MFVDEHLVVAAAGAQTQDGAPRGYVVDGSRGVGQVHRMAQGVEQDSGADFDPVGARGDGRHGRQRFHAGLGGDAVADPDGVVAGPLGGFGHLPGQFHPGAVAAGINQHAPRGQQDSEVVHQ